MPSEFLWRWNGLPGSTARGDLSGELPAPSKPILWAQDPNRVVVASVEEGAGKIIVCLLDFSSRLKRSDKAYDPAARRVLLNVLLRR